MSVVRAISFDVGRTLVRLKGNGFCVDFAEKIGVNAEALRPLFYEYCLTKQYSLQEAVFRLCEEIGYKQPQRIVDEFRPSPVALFEDTLPVLKRLHSEGFIMVAISNCTPWEAGGLDALGIGEYLKEVFYSFIMGAAKPDPVVFRVVQGVLGEPPEHILHIGDSRTADVDGAKAVGWRAALLDRGGQDHVPSDAPDGVPVIASLWRVFDIL